MPTTPIYQYSLVSALLDGVYDGDLTVSHLLEHGNFGIGTFNALDGEMVVLDGHCYQLLSTGAVHEAQPDQLSPFATVTRFDGDIVGVINESIDYLQLIKTLDSFRFSDNYIYGIRIEGEFEWVKTRTVSAQEKPYLPFTEVAKGEVTNSFENISGTIAGFYTPQYEEGIGVAGYHLHFIDKKHETGGHLLDVKVSSAKVLLCIRRVQHIELPSTEGFMHANLTPDDLEEQIKNTEQEK